MIADPDAILAPLRGLAGWVSRAGAEACVLAALVLLAQRLLRGRVSARWSYNLWLLVLLRLVLPALPATRVSPFNLLPRLGPAKQAMVMTEPNCAGAIAASAIPVEEQPAPEASQRDPDLSIEPAVPPVARPLPDAPIASGVRRSSKPDSTPRDTGFPARASAPRAVETFDSFIQQPATELRAPVAQPSPHQTLPSRPTSHASSALKPAPLPTPPTHRWPAGPDVLACLWLLGVILMLARLGRATLRLSRALGRLPAVTAPDVLDLLDDCRATLNVRRRPQLLLSEGAPHSGPALVGLWRPRIVLPADVLRRLSRGELRLVLLHELAHLKRHDLAVNWLLGVLQSLHWFNPVLWLAFRRIRADREVACDELVLTATKDERRAYAPTILKLLELLCDRPGAGSRKAPGADGARAFQFAGMVGVLEPVGTGRGHSELRQLQRRITMIARYDRHANPGRRWGIVGAAVSLVLGGVALTGAVRADEKTASPDVQPAKRDVQPAKHDAPPVADPTAATPVAAAPATATPASADVLPGTSAGQNAADPADPFAGRVEQMAEMRAKIEARLRELKEHPDRGSAKEVELLAAMQKMTQAGVAYADARRQYLQMSADRNGAAPHASAAAAADGSSNPFGSPRAAPAAEAPHRVGQYAGAAPYVIGIVEDHEAQQADERTAEKLRKKVSPQLDGVSLRDALTFIIGQTGADLFTDWRSLEQITTIPVSVAAIDIPAEQALDLVLRAAGGDRIGFAIDRGIVVVADRDRIDRMVVTRVYDVGDLRAKGDLDDMIRTAVAPSSWIKVKPDAARVGAIQEFGDKLVITQTEPNHRQIVRLLALLRERSNPPAPQRQPGRPGRLPTGANGQGARDGDAIPSAREATEKYGNMPWADVPPPLRERALKLWNEKYKNLIYTQQDSNGTVVELNRRQIEQQFRDAVRAMEKEQSGAPDTAQPHPGGADPNETSGRDTAAPGRR